MKRWEVLVWGTFTWKYEGQVSEKMVSKRGVVSHQRFPEKVPLGREELAAMCQNIRVAKRTANCGSTVRDTSKHTTPQTHHNKQHHKHIMSNHITQPISLGTEHHQHETGHWTANCSSAVTNSSQHTTPRHNIPLHKHIIPNHIALLISLG